MTAHDVPDVEPSLLESGSLGQSQPAQLGSPQPMGGPAPPQALDPTVAFVRVSIDLPASLAVALRHRAGPALDTAECAALIVQLYADAPLEPGSARRVLTSAQHARICESLGFSPQTLEELVSAVEGLTSISFGGVRIKLTAEEVEIINARNAIDAPPKEFAAEIFRGMFEAWRNGQIG